MQLSQQPLIQPPSTLSANGEEEVIEVTPDKVGQIIGSKGM
jgi:hypothetical protein